MAAPILVGAYEVFISRSRVRRVVAILGLMLALIAAYSLVRSVVGGLDPTGGASRLPKAAALLAAVAVADAARANRLGAGGRRRSETPADDGRRRRDPACSRGCRRLPGGRRRDALSARSCRSPGSPASTSSRRSSRLPRRRTSSILRHPSTGLEEWRSPHSRELAAFAGRARLFADGAWLFVVVATAGALLPVSSLTEGQRYLYMGSVPVSIGLARALGEAAGRWRRPAVTAAVLYLCACAWQVQLKGADWAWATGMLSRGAALVNADLPACDQGDVVFLTAPIGVRGVYSHFYHQTFSQDGGCEPGSYRALIRMVRTDQPIDVQWESARRLVVTAPAYRGNFVLSTDLREFTVAQRSQPRRQARDAAGPGHVAARRRRPGRDDRPRAVGRSQADPDLLLRSRRGAEDSSAPRTADRASMRYTCR